MQTKLTLRLDDKLIRHAKSYAQGTGKSVSQLVADYFASLREEPYESDEVLTPIVKSLKGALRGSTIDIDNYRRHLEEKYL